MSTDTQSAAPETAPVSQTLGFQRVVQSEKGRSVLEYRAGMHMCHSGGIVQGGFVAAWIDAAMAHAVRSLGQEDVVPLTLEMKTSYFAAARPGIVLAEAWLERAGRSTCFAEGRLTTESGEVLAKASSTIRIGSAARARAAAEKALAGKAG